jgi:ketosteroid isomerase-like protein
MAAESDRAPARDPQDLERLLVARQWAGDLEEMVALYEPDAVLDAGDGRPKRGRAAIRACFAELAAGGRKFAVGKQSPATISGDLALTSTHLPDGSVTAEVARRQPDGSWLWVIDRFSVT